MTLHRDTIVQLTHDMQLRRGLLIKRGTSGRVLSKVALHHACMVEFTVDGRRSWRGLMIMPSPRSGLMRASRRSPGCTNFATLIRSLVRLPGDPRPSGGRSRTCP